MKINAKRKMICYISCW